MATKTQQRTEDLGFLKRELLDIQTKLSQWHNLLRNPDKGLLLELYPTVPNMTYIVGRYTFRDGMVFDRDGRVIQHPDDLLMEKEDITALGLLIIQYLMGQHDMLVSFIIAVGGEIDDALLPQDFGEIPS